MPLAPAIPLANMTYLSIKFDGTVQGAIDVLYAIDAGLTDLLLIKATVEATKENPSSPNSYFIKFQPSLNGVPIGDELRADPGSWIVVASSGIVRIRILTEPEYFAEFEE